MMDMKPALALPEGLELIDIEKGDENLTMTVVSTQSFPCCPCCSTEAARMHSCYTRHMADLPCGGQGVLARHLAAHRRSKTESCSATLLVNALKCGPYLPSNAHICPQT